ncbi:hypothetical protein [Sphingomonas koreensis]|uniref:hypothetical protein n=1 Tax=Sphingomonas koreensis TaxID=93064 RepID=UPI000F7D7AAB|nr:hypothetical protein [Sphingomonas koreensis]MDC7808827.1 hypothetical protein [Sphingomonas koreensis]RSU98966.1 hypothetical protein CA256_03280 [Sphingomonas koreensis]
MSDTLALDLAPAAKVLREHQVHTLPALQMALEDLIRTARDHRGGAGPINLADFDPKEGVTVSLNDDGSGVLFIAFRRKRP